MDFVEEYYSSVWGYYPFDDNDENKYRSKKIIDYLMDCNIEEKHILKFVEEAPKQDFLTPDILPEWLWTNSLIKKDEFYYHNLLHIKSKAPTWDALTNKETNYPFYLEIKIQFTIDNLTDYFYKKFRIPMDLIDRKRDEGAFNYLLNKYRGISFISSLDFVLSLIDYMHNEGDDTYNVLDLSKYEKEVYEILFRKVEQSKLEKTNKIVWR